MQERVWHGERGRAAQSSRRGDVVGRELGWGSAGAHDDGEVLVSAFGRWLAGGVGAPRRRCWLSHRCAVRARIGGSRPELN